MVYETNTNNTRDEKGKPTPLGGQDDTNRQEEPIWAVGAKEDDNKRYRELLSYMEDRRIEAREKQQEDEERKRRARKREESYELLRISMRFLREKEEG